MMAEMELQAVIPVIGVSDTDGAILRNLTGDDATISVGVQDYGSLEGTSMATPHVTGAIALYLTANTLASPAAVSTALQQAASVDRISLLMPQDYDMALAFQARNLNLLHRLC